MTYFYLDSKISITFQYNSLYITSQIFLIELFYTRTLIFIKKKLVGMYLSVINTVIYIRLY